MYIKKFDITDKGGGIQGYGLLNDNNGTFGVLSKKVACDLAKRGKLPPYDGKMIPCIEKTLTGVMSGNAKIEQLSFERCLQYCGSVQMDYLQEVVVIGEYVYMESKHQRLYLVGTLYVPAKYEKIYGKFCKYLASKKCLIRSSGVYTVTGNFAIVSLNNVFDFRNILEVFGRGGFLMDLSHISKFDYDIAGEGDMYRTICENAHKGMYFSELDARHKFRGVVNYVRGISERRLLE